MTLRADVYGTGIGRFSGKKLGKHSYSGTYLKGKRSAESKRLKELSRQRELAKKKAAPVPTKSGKIVTVRQRDPKTPVYVIW